jgi:hypothetical protein
MFPSLSNARDAGISEEAAKELMAQVGLPQHIQTYIVQFENGMPQAE